VDFNEGMSLAHKIWAKEYGDVEVIKVKTITFDELMEKHPDIKEIDFMSIDVEGHEMEILKTIDFEKYKFNFITIEKSDPEKIKEYMKKNRYKLFMELGADIMFVREDE
jgi:FkbM family methyltransferase